MVTNPIENPEDRRRSKRVDKTIPMVVGGNTAEGKYFRGEVVTENISQHGAVLWMKPLFPAGAIVELAHRLKSEFTLARVVRIGEEMRNGLAPVAVEILGPTRTFWVH